MEHDFCAPKSQSTERKYQEPIDLEAPSEIELSWRAELFQQGQQSRIDKRSTSTISLADIEQQGIYSLVEAAMLKGEEHLPAAF